MSLIFPSFRCAAARLIFAAMACGVAGVVPVSAQTTISGTVFAPNLTDPLPNILVYVATPGVAVSAFQPGPGSCTAPNDSVSGMPLAKALTDYKGSFTVTSPELTALGTTTVDLVIQAGKWRRQYPNTAIVAGQPISVGKLYMPKDATEGDLPQIAVVTGQVDAVECVLQSMGVSPKEVTDVGGGGHINFFPGTTNPGSKATATSTVRESDLMLNSTLLNSYDMVMFGCQGTSTDATVTNSTAALTNLSQYASNGGRAFATHYEYVWLNKPQTFQAAANWPEPETSPIGSAIGTITVDTSYPEGVTLAQWLQNLEVIGSLPASAGAYGQITGVQNSKQDQWGVIAPTQSWGTLNGPYTAAVGIPVMQFTFDTPLGNLGTPAVALAFTNNPSTFKQGDSADSITINVTDTSTSAADTTLAMTLALPSGVTATSLAGVNGSTGWVCSSATLTCIRISPLAAGASDPLALVVSIAANAPVDTSTITATLGGGGLAGTNQCGRVLFNEYHVEPPAQSAGVFPTECPTGAVSAPEKFLEFSLYNLSNFVGPSSSDTITIVGQPIINWPTPAPIYYGTALSGTQLDATASAPGTFVYTPAAGVLESVGTHTLSTVFTPTDTVGYLNATASVQLTVLPDTTTTTITNVVSPIYYGQIIADLALESVSGNNGVAVDGGTLNFLIDGVVVCQLPANVAGVCPPPTGVGYSAGTHTIQSVYTGNDRFAGSQSPISNVVVLPDPTTTALATGLTPAYAGQAVPLTATVGDQYTTAVGPVKFMDGATVIGQGATDGTGVAKLTTTTLIVGTHSLTACFVASLNFNASCSAPIAQVISAVPTVPLATVTLLTSSLNPSVVGQSVTFTASTETTGPFVAIPTGTVTFLDGTAMLGSVPLDATGKALYSTTALAAGTHPITASYVPAAQVAPAPMFAASVSAVVKQVVTTGVGSAGVGFVMSVTPTTITGTPGVTTAVTVTITDLNGFNLPVALACSGLPYEGTCTFGQKIIAAGGGSTTVIVASTPPRPCSALASSGERPGPGLPNAPWLAAIALGAFFARKRRKLLQGLALAFAICFLPMLNGCSTGCADLGTQPGTYSFTLTGTAVPAGTTTVTTPPSSAAQMQTQTMTMVIQP